MGKRKPDNSRLGMAGDVLLAVKKLSSDQRVVLKALNSTYERVPEFNYLSFKYLATATTMPRKRVRVVVRQLARQGLAEYAKGLFDEYGKVAGSGYATTILGNIVAQVISDDG